MPMVNGKKYSYDKAGKAAASKARKKKMGGGMMYDSNPRTKKGTGGRMMYTDGGLVDFKNPN